ncbi:MAG: magnesium protoporphyrin IX methyltransferase [Synechococcaceae cyanobacterium SM2_3_1]|nr:magnesium protoporphyrin IX methyltransferase [Synechococcaceae cyanobacterium SM2_3_1]
MDEKGVVREYFNTTGFERWRRIYGQDEVNWVQQDIRQGHERTLETVLSWLESVKGLPICDAGCGVGSLAIPLAQRGAQVQASDISEQMVGEARQRAESQGLQNNPHFLVSDLEHLQGSFDVVICLDVMIHYPEADALRMVEKLTQLAKQRLIFSFAPKTPLLTALKKIGEFFPGPSKTTRAYQHREQALVQQLQALGWEVKQRETIRSRFYFAWILDCCPGTP